MSVNTTTYNMPAELEARIKLIKLFFTLCNKSLFDPKKISEAQWYTLDTFFKFYASHEWAIDNNLKINPSSLRIGAGGIWWYFEIEFEVSGDNLTYTHSFKIRDRDLFRMLVLLNGLLRPKDDELFRLHHLDFPYLFNDKNEKVNSIFHDTLCKDIATSLKIPYFYPYRSSIRTKI